jgi:hypothetical protein
VTGAATIGGAATASAATGGVTGRAATGGAAGTGGTTGFTALVFAAIGFGVLEGAVVGVLVAAGVGCGEIDAGLGGTAGRTGICGGVRVLSPSRLRISEGALAAAGLVICGGSLARRSSSGSMRSSPSPEAPTGPDGAPDAAAGAGAAEGAPTPSLAHGSLNASPSRGVSTGRSGSGSGRGRDLGSIMYEGDLRQSRRRSCNVRASKPTRRLTDRSARVFDP